MIKIINIVTSTSLKNCTGPNTSLTSRICNIMCSRVPCIFFGAGWADNSGRFTTVN